MTSHQGSIEFIMKRWRESDTCVDLARAACPHTLRNQARTGWKRQDSYKLKEFILPIQYEFFCLTKLQSTPLNQGFPHPVYEGYNPDGFSVLPGFTKESRIPGESLINLVVQKSWLNQSLWTRCGHVYRRPYAWQRQNTAHLHKHMKHEGGSTTLQPSLQHLVLV